VPLADGVALRTTWIVWRRPFRNGLNGNSPAPCARWWAGPGLRCVSCHVKYSSLDDSRGFDAVADRVLGRVYCGGDWNSRSAYRDAGGWRAGNIGFRMALVQSVR
jgi:hypothetical protein